MRFDNTPRRVARDNTRDLADFLGLNTPKTQKNDTGAGILVPCCAKSIAMVYPVKQCYKGIYDPLVALECGTIFEELNLPFERSMCSSKRREGCL